MFTFSQLGAHVDNTAKTVIFSICLPSISQSFSVHLLYISKADQYDKSVPSSSIPLKLSPNQGKWGDLAQLLWESDPMTLPDGTYFYRYEIRGPAKDGSGPVRSLYFGDPFARETSSGIFSIFRIGRTPYTWQQPAFTVPALNDAIIYELNVAEFNDTFDGVVDRLPYLKSLGINVIELLPVTSVADPSQWGYMPIFYFSPEERYGGPDALKRLVDESHKAGIAVILDMVYAHTDCLFAYQAGYDRFFDLWRDNKYWDPATQTTVRSPNPLVCEYSNFGHKSDFRMLSTLEFYKAVNRYWIEEYQIDGFRYDHVNGFLDTEPVFNNDGSPNWDAYRPTFKALQELTKDTYGFSKDTRFPRFKAPDGTSRIIQIAEDLNKGAYQLAPISNSAITGCWEEALFDASTDMAINDCLNGSYLSELLLSDARWSNVGATKDVNGDNIPVSPILYNNCHDKSHLMFRITRKQKWEPTGFDYPGGTSNLEWFRLQPFAIALLTGVGTPMLWEGEEFAEAYGLPDSGQGRVRGTRPIHWDYFYSPSEMPNSPTVLPLTTLYRHLCALRLKHGALRGPRGNAKKEEEDFPSQVAVYRRWLGAQVFVIAINFSRNAVGLNIPFGHVGRWVDVLDECYNTAAPYCKDVNNSSEWVDVSINGNFGRIFMLT